MKVREQNRARELRSKGFSIKEIADHLNVSKSSVSVWVRQVHLDQTAKKRIESRLTAGQLAARKAKKELTEQKVQDARDKAEKLLQNYRFDDDASNKLLCTILHYCEGNKSLREGVVFTNSDPMLVKTFLRLFRGSFILDERKFRVCVHLHKYHDKDKQLNFWSKTAKIPLNQFIKPYIKKNSGKYRKEGYQGCVSIRYADTQIAREIRAIALAYMKKGL